MDLSGIDFADITDLSPLYVMDDLTDLWLVNTQNLDATALDVLLDNLETIESPDTEGVLYMTQADYDAFNAAGGGLLADWNDEPGHHVEFVPEPSTLLLAIVTLGSLIGWRRWRQQSVAMLVFLSLLTTAFISPATANIYRWDNGELITEKDAEPGADLSEMDLSYADLEGASLSRAQFFSSDLTYAHFLDAD